MSFRTGWSQRLETDRNGAERRKRQKPKQIKPWIWDTLVIDEATSFKNQDSGRSADLNLIRRLFNRIILLAGMPSPNGYIDLWAQYRIIDRGQRLGHGISDS